MRIIPAVILFVLLVIPSWLSCNVMPSSWMLFKEGEVTPVIILPTQAKGNEKKAAEWFQTIFNAITNQKIQILPEDNREATAQKPRIYIGNTRHLQKATIPGGVNGNGIVYFSKNNALYFHAPQNVNLKHAVSDFFERNLNVFYVDQDEYHCPVMASVELQNIEVVQNPSFNFRVSSFPSSQDYNYCHWHGTNMIEEEWGSWGHGMNRLIDRSVLSGSEGIEIQAKIDGERSEEQFCFSSEATYKALVSGIKKKMVEKPDAYYYNIAPDDNNLICSCDHCLSINAASKSNSNAVVSLVNRLASAFPDLCITTLAYYTTRNPSGIRMAKNTAVIVSTIDYPKGMPLRNSSKASSFSNWVAGWKKVASNIFVWDYTVQYSNYLDFFPNMPALKEDLAYFKELGINGVYEQGSEEQYSLFGDYKNYAISKLLWNTEADLDSLKYAFFENAYPAHADALAEFVTSIEQKSAASKKSLDIYGNIKNASSHYLSEAEFNSFYYSFYDWIREENSKSESRKLKSLQNALKFVKLEWMRMQGYSNGGYATIQSASVLVDSEVMELVKDLKTNSRPIYIFNEVGDSVSNYCSWWTKYILNESLVNALAGQPVEVKGNADECNGGKPQKALTDGVIGFHDYAAGWMVFNQQNVEVSFPIVGKEGYKNISIGALYSPRHRIQLPSSIALYGEAGNKPSTLLTKINPVLKEEGTQQRVECKLTASLQGFSRIKIVIISPSVLSLTDRRTSIAIDEIKLY